MFEEASVFSRRGPQSFKVVMILVIIFHEYNSYSILTELYRKFDPGFNI